MFGFPKKTAPARAAAPVDWKVELVARVVQALGVSDDDTILEIGFGDGAALRAVLPLVPRGRIAGIETAGARVRQAVEAFPVEYRNFRADFKEAMVSRIPYPDEHFTKVFALDSVGSWLSIPKGLSEIRRVLFPLGRVVFSLPPKPREGQAFVPVVEVKALLTDAGFENVEILPAPSPSASVILMGQKAL